MYPAVSYSDVFNVNIPNFSQPFQSKIETLVKTAYNKLEESKKLYKEAEDILLEELDLKNFKPTDKNIAIVSAKEAFLNGRLDAEYYMPKYKQIEDKIKSYKGGWEYLGKICNVYDNNFNPNPEKEYKYIELSNIGNYGGIINYTLDIGKNLPTRARRIVKKGNLIISSVEGSLDKVALIPQEFNNAICSTGFYVLDSNKVNSETLLVFFKLKEIKELMKQRCSGTILTAINKEDFITIPIPKINLQTQQIIKQKIQQSFRLREQSKQLLETAKKAVEIAIEEDEGKAIKFIECQLT